MFPARAGSAKKTAAQINQQLVVAQANSIGPFVSASPVVRSPLSNSTNPSEANATDGSGTNDEEHVEASREFEAGDEGGVVAEVDSAIEAIGLRS